LIGSQGTNHQEFSRRSAAPKLRLLPIPKARRLALGLDLAAAPQLDFAAGPPDSCHLARMSAWTEIRKTSYYPA